jgi:chemotaxis protein MotA
MNLATIIGLIMGVGCLMIAYVIEGGNPAELLLPSPLIIIFGGTFGALFLQFDMVDVLSIPKLIGLALRMPPTKEKDLALRFVALAEKSRRDGLLSLEEDMQSIDAN